jgi:hypothetical protein
LLLEPQAHATAEQHNLLLPAELRDKRNMPTGPTVLTNIAGRMPTANGWNEVLNTPWGILPVATLEAIKDWDPAAKAFNPLIVEQYLATLDTILQSA